MSAVAVFLLCILGLIWHLLGRIERLEWDARMEREARENAAPKEEKR